jgi:hypothetical protein
MQGVLAIDASGFHLRVCLDEFHHRVVLCAGLDPHRVDIQGFRELQDLERNLQIQSV